MLTFEFEPPRDQGTCACCGGRTTSLTRFVHQNGSAHAVYLASFSDNHPEKTVGIAVGLGQWGEGTGPGDRVAFAIELRNGEEKYGVRVVEPNESPWPNATFLGRMLTREEALNHSLLQEVFRITDHIVVEDGPVKDYLSGNVISGA